MPLLFQGCIYTVRLVCKDASASSQTFRIFSSGAKLQCYLASDVELYEDIATLYKTLVQRDIGRDNTSGVAGDQ
jgi:hypothetical protein